jgi:hypothetical protein
MGVMPEDLRFIDSIDWTNPDEISDDGMRVFNVRCRVPLPRHAYRSALISADALPLERGLEDIGHTGDGTDRVIIDDGDGVLLEPDQTGDPGADDEVTFGPRLVSGIASSTSVDFFGTEMSLRALRLMATQMMATNGIPYLPRHNNGLGGAVEWDSVIGRTVHAEVVPAESVAKAFNEAEAQFILRVTIALFDDEPVAQTLLRRIGRGEEIGQSIGGWFTSLQIIQTEDGEVERVIVQGVELDHLAVTRAPANPDSNGIVNLRTALADSAAMHRAASLLPRVMGGQTVCTTPAIGRSIVAQATDERHVVAMVDNGDGTASITLEIADDDAEGDEQTRDASAEPTEQGEPVTPVTLDTSPPTGDDAGDDARRSALDSFTPAPALAEGTQEPQMPEQTDTGVSLDAIRAMLGEALQPVTDRLVALEAPLVEERATPTPEPTPSPNVVAEAEQRAAEATARAEAAERALALANRRPMRVGRSMVPAFSAGPAARTGYEGLVAEARSKAPTLAAVAERCIGTVTEPDGPGKVSRSDCERTLASMLNAAEADGIITDPNHRAVWQ